MLFSLESHILKYILKYSVLYAFLYIEIKMFIYDYDSKIKIRFSGAVRVYFWADVGVFRQIRLKII